MRRREFLALIGGATAWPLRAAAQGMRVRRIGVLMTEDESTSESKARKATFEGTLSQLGWQPGRTLQIEYRWAISNPERARAGTAELLEQKSELIVAAATPAARAAWQATKTIPVVFVGVSEPVAQGFVASLARPGGNMTGFSFLEPTFGPKWLELLKDIAPDVKHVGILFNPDTAPYAVPAARAAESAAPGLGTKAETIAVRGPEQLREVIARVASEPGGGLIYPPDAHTAAHGDLVIEASERYRLPAIHGLKYMAERGALGFYGVDVVHLFRSAAGYVDRILKGEKVSELPVQQPTKFELVINLKAARAIGLTVPPTLLSRADEVIE